MLCWKKKVPSHYRWPMAVEVFAPAKVNLTLHVTGQKDDGYHLVDSLVAFGPVGDHLTIEDGDALSLTVDGPQASGVPTDMDNLVLKVARIMAPGRGLSVRLQKNLPTAAGIGGGSSDAAAMFRGLSEAGERKVDLGSGGHAKAEKIFALGADITMCISPRPQRVRGIGEDCRAVKIPSLPAVLVNPGVAVATRDVFKALKQKDNPAMVADLPEFSGVADFAPWLAMQRNDLEAPACQVCPDIRDVLAVLAGLHGCLLSRMSGSGATCFAIFPTPEMAQAAGRQLQVDHPEWWVADGLLGDWAAKAAPVFS